MLQGGPVDQRLIDEGRAVALQGGGTAAAASYDAGVSIARGQGADQVLLDVARGYIQQVGGPVALAAFDTGVALGYAKTLQEAGYAGLHALIRGNDGIEKILNFVERVGQARNLGVGLQNLLESDLAEDFLHAVNQYGPTPNAAVINRELQPYIDAIRENMSLLDYASGDLATQWHVDEAIVRAAQALMRSRDGAIDERLLHEMTRPRVTSIGKLDVGGDAAGTTERNDAFARQGQAMAEGDAELTAHRMNSRNFKLRHWQRGFDVGTAVSYRHSEFGPGQAVIRDSLRGLSQSSGYNVARDLQYRRTLAIRAALDGLTRQVLTKRETALSAFSTTLGASSAPAVRAPRAALTVPLAPMVASRTETTVEDETAGYSRT